jgi:hypothetical protein
MAALAFAGCGANAGTSDCASFLVPAVVGNCLGADGYCIEFREAITPADAESVCTQTGRTWSPTACPAASQALPHCALMVNAAPRIFFSATHTRAKCEGDGGGCFMPGTAP